MRDHVEKIFEDLMARIDVYPGTTRFIIMKHLIALLVAIVLIIGLDRSVEFIRTITN